MKHVARVILGFLGLIAGVAAFYALTMLPAWVYAGAIAIPVCWVMGYALQQVFTGLREDRADKKASS